MLQKAEIQKKLTTETKQLQIMEKQKTDLENRIIEMDYENTKAQEQLQRSSVIQSQELEHLRHDKELFNMETEVIAASLPQFSWKSK